MASNICFIDFETTGVDILTDHPIQLGCLLVDGNLNLIKEFSSYIRPLNEFIISERAFLIHGITRETILSSPDEKTVLANFFLQIGHNYKFAAWNMSFDIAFFKIFCLRNGFENHLNKINYRHIDVQTVSFIANQLGLITGNVNSLSDLASYFGIERSHNHSALEDARILYFIYKRLFSILSEKLLIER